MMYYVQSCPRPCLDDIKNFVHKIASITTRCVCQCMSKRHHSFQKLSEIYSQVLEVSDLRFTHCSSAFFTNLGLYLLIRPHSKDRTKIKQAVVLKHNKPRPRVAHRGIQRFFGIDQTFNQVIIPWSLYTFPENFMQIGPAVF